MGSSVGGDADVVTRMASFSLVQQASLERTFDGDRWDTSALDVSRCARLADALHRVTTVCRDSDKALACAEFLLKDLQSVTDYVVSETKRGATLALQLCRDVGEYSGGVLLEPRSLSLAGEAARMDFIVRLSSEADRLGEQSRRLDYIVRVLAEMRRSDELLFAMDSSSVSDDEIEEEAGEADVSER
jgi:hypothetical protein